jgi:DNA-binding NarL/FixJ family response regulator
MQLQFDGKCGQIAVRQAANKLSVMQIKVAIVDDDKDMRTSLASLIRKTPSLQLSGNYANAEIALEEISRQTPDVVLMDINMPGMSGIECVRQLKVIIPAVQVLMLTVYEDSDSLFNSLKAGASGYLLKRTNSTQLLEAVRDVHAGGSPMSPQLARRVVQFFSKPQGETSATHLSPGEREFLQLLAKGYVYKEIAEHMGISTDTVRYYVRTVYEKLHVHSRTEAVVKFLHG